jgi:hypothetical protein
MNAPAVCADLEKTIIEKSPILICKMWRIMLA